MLEIHCPMKEIFLDKQKFDKPNINLSFCRVESCVWYKLGFYSHHYLTAEMNPTATCFVIKWNGNNVGFISFLPLFGFHQQDNYRISRFVIIPDYQGIGLSRRIIDFFASIYKSIGKNMCIKTIHPKIGFMLQTNFKWKQTRKFSQRLDIFNAKWCKMKNVLSRASYCYKYVGDALYGYEDMLIPLDEARKKYFKKDQLSLF